jgi:hypothetical protein
MLKDLVFFRSRRSVGRGIDTNGTARVCAVILIGIALEILLDILIAAYYALGEKGRPKMLDGSGLLPQGMARHGRRAGGI